MRTDEKVKILLSSGLSISEVMAIVTTSALHDLIKDELPLLLESVAKSDPELYMRYVSRGMIIRYT